MRSITENQAKKECWNDPSCKMFYQVCEDNRFRQCDGNAYVQESGCGKIIGLSSLFIKAAPICVIYHTTTPTTTPVTTGTTGRFYKID